MRQGASRILSDFQGRRGADLNDQVESAPCPTHRAAHECRGTISPVAEFVYTPLAVSGRRPRLLGSSCVCAAVHRCSSAAAAIVPRSIALELAHSKPGVARNARPTSATKRADAAASTTLRVPAAIANGKRM